MKSIIFGALFFVSIHFGWAHELPLIPKQAAAALKSEVQNFQENVSSAGRAPFCEECERSRDDGGESAQGSLYTMSSAIADMKSDPLRFIGRDYPAGSLGAGGNLSCIFKNSKVYVELEGCRPNRTQRMTAFRAKIYNLDGRLLDVCLNNENDPFPLDNPQSSRGWSVTATKASPLASNLGFAQVSQQYTSTASNSNNPICSYSVNSTVCRNGGVDAGGALQREHQNPGRQVREIHDLIMAVAR